MNNLIVWQRTTMFVIGYVKDKKKYAILGLTTPATSILYEMGSSGLIDDDCVELYKTSESDRSKETEILKAYAEKLENILDRKRKINSILNDLDI